MAEAALDDYLGLLAQPLGECRLWIFHGASGGGKSSQMRMLATQHPELRHCQQRWISPLEAPGPATEVLLLDELITLSDTLAIGPALRRCRRLLVASHVDPLLLWPWRLRAPSRCYRLDGRRDKLATFLRQQGVAFSEPTLDRFIRRFGTRYNALGIILKQGCPNDLDLSMAFFSRGGRIILTQPTRRQALGARRNRR
jgi:hypothetical protein